VSLPRRLHSPPIMRVGFVLAGLVLAAALSTPTESKNKPASAGRRFAEAEPNQPARTEKPAATDSEPPPSDSTVVLVGAGDIGSSAGAEATAKLLDAIPGTVITLGDNAYPDGTSANYASYDRHWGRHKERTRPCPGNHDYHTPGAKPYFEYFGANAGPTGRGYYSFDLGDWHVVSLNSNTDMKAGSAQEQWLRDDLKANRKDCILAYWHYPRFSVGPHGSIMESHDVWQALYEAGAEVVLVGHDHDYQRFAPQTADGQADPERGIREFVAGMGGSSHYVIKKTLPNLEAQNDNTYGVLKLTLGRGTYRWEFVPVAGGAYADSGTGICHR